MGEVHEQVGPSDGELLRLSASGQKPDAFASLVSRHVDLVFSTARALMHDRQLAEDVTQDVFLLLARKSKTLLDRHDLGGWLYHAAVLEARALLRKRAGESKKIQQLAHLPPDKKDPMRLQSWQEIEPHVHEALESLSDPEREAVVLRYLQRRPYDLIASTLGVTEAAARQRVHRALDHLRELLTARGVVASAAALGTAMKLNAVQAAPAGLASRMVEAAGQLAKSPAPAASGTLYLGPIKAKLLAMLILGTAGITTGSVVAILALSHPAGESVYLENRPKGPHALTTGATTRPAAPPVRRPFHVIQAQAYDDRKGTRTVAGFIGWIGKGDWLRFNRVDLGPASMQPATFTAVVDCPKEYAGNTIKVHVDRLDGPVVATLTVKATGSYGNWRAQSTPLSGAGGIHDLFLEFSGGGWNLDTIKVTLPHRSGTVPISAVSFNDAFGVTSRGGVVRETTDGYWVKYEGLDFGDGVNTLALTYACGNPKGGGSIQVLRGGPQGTLIAEMPVQSTGSWDEFSTRLVSLPELKGSHDIVLRFTGKWHGIANVLMIHFVHMENNAATMPASRPTSAPADGTLSEGGYR